MQFAYRQVRTTSQITDVNRLHLIGRSGGEKSDKQLNS